MKDLLMCWNESLTSKKRLGEITNQFLKDSLISNIYMWSHQYLQDDVQAGFLSLIDFEWLSSKY